MFKFLIFSLNTFISEDFEGEDSFTHFDASR